MTDLTHLLTLLDRKAKHWRLQCVNSAERGRRVCASGRFATNRPTPAEAVEAALAKLQVLGERTRLKLLETS